MIKKAKVETYVERLWCGACDKELTKSMTVLCTYPAKYQYFCKTCDYSEISIENYPKTIYKEIPND